MKIPAKVEVELKKIQKLLNSIWVCAQNNDSQSCDEIMDMLEGKVDDYENKNVDGLAALREAIVKAMPNE